MEQALKRGRGRPPKEGETKRAFFTTRIRESLKARLEADAAEQGRSLSEEIELRLEDSYRGLEWRFGGKRSLDWAVMLFSNLDFAGGMEATQQGHPEWTMDEWLKDRRCFEVALQTLVVTVWAHHPLPMTDEDFYEFCRTLFNWRSKQTRYEEALGRQGPYDDTLRGHASDSVTIAKMAAEAAGERGVPAAGDAAAEWADERAAEAAKTAADPTAPADEKAGDEAA